MSSEAQSVNTALCQHQSSPVRFSIVGSGIFYARQHNIMLQRVYATPIPPKSDGFAPNGSAEYKGGRNFRLVRGCMSETEIDRGIFTIEYEYKVVCALSNSATFGDFE